MPHLSAKINRSVLQLLLSASERLNQHSAVHLMHIAAIIERLAQEEDPGSALSRIEAIAFGDDNEADEIEELRKNIGL